MRLFVAIDLPDPVKDHLETLRAPLSGARWVKRPAYHLTLQFLGDGIPDAQLDEITSALRAVEAPRFEMSLRGVGQFSRRVIWVGVDAPSALNKLHASVGQALAGVGFPPDDRRFSPHITLARLRDGNDREIQTFLQRHNGFSTPAFPVAECVLFSSQLTADGPVYTRQAVYLLV